MDLEFTFPKRKICKKNIDAWKHAATAIRNLRCKTLSIRNNKSPVP